MASQPHKAPAPAQVAWFPAADQPAMLDTTPPLAAPQFSPLLPLQDISVITASSSEEEEAEMEGKMDC